MAKENPRRGYDRIVGALANLGFLLSDQTVGNILRRHGFSPAPKRKQAVFWKNLIHSHMEVLVGADLFTVEVLTLKGLVTYFVLFFIRLESRRVSLAGMMPYPAQEWMEQQARSATMVEWGFLRGCRYLLHDRDTKFCASFRELIESGSRNDSLASEEPELEFVCGALGERKAAVRCRQRLGGLLKHYEREAA
jgi:putative transposase